MAIMIGLLKTLFKKQAKFISNKLSMDFCQCSLSDVALNTSNKNPYLKSKYEMNFTFFFGKVSLDYVLGEGMGDRNERIFGY